MQEQPAGRKVPGPSPLTRQRQEYARLIARGVSNAEACRLVGVNRRTGTRWRYGRTVPARDGGERKYPAMTEVTKETPQRSSRYLSEAEREVIAERRRAKASMRSIARELGRDVSSVSRELGRNRDPAGRYRPSAAQRMATARLARPRERKVAADRSLGALVQGWLGLKWARADQRGAGDRVPERPGTAPRGGDDLSSLVRERLALHNPGCSGRVGASITG